MKYEIIFILLSVFLIIFACKKEAKISDYNGIYKLTEGKSIVSSVEINGNITIVSTMGMEVPVSCEIKGNSIVLLDPARGNVPFEIINSKTLKCEYPFFQGTYIKQ
ncbi:MAG: hypothetical protein PF637_11820 [Spirochaetes bacterium]|jgi:hypothetical protein|nr:hypothetical protein [Spirochaetota bacterium]